MTFNNVDDFVEAILSFCQDGEVVMAGEVSTLDVELIDPVMRTNVSLPYFFNVSIFQFMFPSVMMFFDFFDIMFPVSMYFRGNFNDFELHQQIITITSFVVNPI